MVSSKKLWLRPYLLIIPILPCNHAFQEPGPGALSMTIALHYTTLDLFLTFIAASPPGLAVDNPPSLTHSCTCLSEQENSISPLTRELRCLLAIPQTFLSCLTTLSTRAAARVLSLACFRGAGVRDPGWARAEVVATSGRWTVIGAKAGCWEIGRRVPLAVGKRSRDIAINQTGEIRHVCYCRMRIIGGEA
jgi:hypothetical protein